MIRDQSIRDALVAIEPDLEKLQSSVGAHGAYSVINALLIAHFKQIEEQILATKSASQWKVEAMGNEQVVVIYARNRTDTSRVDSLELRLKVEFPRTSFSLDPTLAVLILQAGLYNYSVKTDSSGNASLADSNATTGVAIRPAVLFTLWPAALRDHAGWAFGPSVYFGYAHDFVFDIGAALTLAYRDVAQLSIGYVSASMPQSVSGEVKADSPILENAVLNYRRVASMAICLSVRGIGSPL